MDIVRFCFRIPQHSSFSWCNYSMFVDGEQIDLRMCENSKNLEFISCCFDSSHHQVMDVRVRTVPFQNLARFILERTSSSKHPLVDSILSSVSNLNLAFIS